nr:MFS transporter [Sinorhizobium meliloti]
MQTPSVWIQTFRTPTWMDFLRLNHRLTAADKEVVDISRPCMMESFRRRRCFRSNVRRTHRAPGPSKWSCPQKTGHAQA